jgi:hypothetical protein
VISYSTFNKPPPDNSRFGRTDTDPVGGALDLPAGPGLEVLCTDPTELAGTGGRLESLASSEPFAPGIISALLLRLYGGPPPSADTPWLEPADHYTARCETSNGARVLMLAAVDGARTLTPSPDDTWGTHLVDVNIALGNLTTVVGEETRAWTASAAPSPGVTTSGEFAAALRVRRRGARGVRFKITVTGPPGRLIRVLLRRGRRTIARRTVNLNKSGRANVAFTVHRPGRYRALVRVGGGAVLALPAKRVRSRG